MQSHDFSLHTSVNHITSSLGVTLPSEILHRCKSTIKGTPKNTHSQKAHVHPNFFFKARL